MSAGFPGSYDTRCVSHIFSYIVRAGIVSTSVIQCERPEQQIIPEQLTSIKSAGSHQPKQRFTTEIAARSVGRTVTSVVNSHSQSSTANVWLLGNRFEVQSV
jgi:hypothetical protein